MRLTSTVAAAALLLLAPLPVAGHEGGPPGHDHGAGQADTASPTDSAPAAAAPTPASDEEDTDFAPPEAEGEIPPEAAPPRRRAYGETSEEETPRRHTDIPDTTWRRRVRDTEDTSDNRFIDPAHFHVEMRFGPYSPNVDDEPGLGAPVYEEYFGTSPNFYFGLELDWLPIYIPYVGSLGLGFGWGWTSASGNTRLIDGTEAEDSETSLTIFPMHTSGIFRLDGLVRDLHIPVVPYGKFGFGFAPWSVSAPSDNTVDGVSAEGTSIGIHAALGGAIALNGFDQAAAMAMREETGIRYAYLWGEWMGDFLGEFSDGQMYVGTSTVIFGIGLDF